MLGMLEIDKDVRKIEMTYKNMPSDKILSVKIPTPKKRYIKKVAKLLNGKRVVIGDFWEAENLSKWGISQVSPKKLYRYLTGQIYKKTLAEFKIPPDKAYVSINAGRIGSAEHFGLDEIIKNARHVSLYSSDGYELSEYIFENYGISPIRHGSRANIVIYMYEKDFSVCFKSDGGEFYLKDMSVERDARFCKIPTTHLKSLYLALIEEGRLRPEEINIEKLAFEREN